MKRKYLYFKPGSQNFRLLEALKHGPVHTHEGLSDPSLKFGYLSRRIKDVKEYLKPKGFTIVKTKITPNSFRYHLSPITEKVSWWQHLKSLIRKEQTA
jgi:hypothetical protein